MPGTKKSAAKKTTASAKKTLDTTMQPAASARTAPKPSREEIAKLAYLFWDERGREDGHADQDWLRAERELLGLGPQSPAR